jgi:hypothetical protein
VLREATEAVFGAAEDTRLREQLRLDGGRASSK